MSVYLSTINIWINFNVCFKIDMNLKAINNFFQILHKDNQCFIYSGDFSDDITEKIISLSENNFKNNYSASKLSNKVSFLMAECFQNIIRHGNSENIEKEIDNKFTGFFITRHIGTHLFISSANIIHNIEVDNLKGKIEHVNNLNQSELKALYRNVLKNEDVSNKGGAGLGLIEMARKSDQSLGFDFEKVNDKFSYFFLQINIKGLNEKTHDHEDLSPISNIIQLRKTLWENNVIMIHKGDFSQDALIPIIRMIENNIKSQFSKHDRKKKRMFHLMVEVLQNISRHAYIDNNTKDAIFIVSRIEESYTVNTGNYIENKHIDKLQKQINLLNSMSKDELDVLYLDTLKNGILSEKGGAGLGLIDIIKESSKPVEYEFINKDKKISFFSLHVNI